MSGGGRPAKPIEQKRRLGNPGKRALPAKGSLVVLPAAHETPEPTRPLGLAGRELWDRVWPAARHWLSPQIDLEALMIVCEQLDERVALRIRVLREGHSYDRRDLRELDRQLMSGLAVLGFTPSDRAKLGLAEVQTRSKLEQLREKYAPQVAD